ncbi:MAG: hypothetical protein AAF378_00155 [Cyanobacteria bacterium P01_A01_bin.84]
MSNHKIIGILPSENVEPRQFLRYCFDIDQFLLEEILEEETSFGYCTKCVRLLSKILGLQRKTIREWGDNPNFEGMPQHARVTCNYALMALSKEDLDRIVCSDSQAPSISARQFIEEMLLKGLSPSDREKAVSSTKFRGRCFSLISTTLHLSKNTIYQWGNDIELNDMPKHYEHTLAYALTAYKKQEKIAA